jgi:hypothetical protein
VKTESSALEMMEKGGATPADTEPKREMLRELQGKKRKALAKLNELDKGSGKRSASKMAAAPAEIKRQDAPPPQQKRATDAKLPTTRPPATSQAPAVAAESSGKSVEQLVQLRPNSLSRLVSRNRDRSPHTHRTQEEELKQVKEKAKKLTATKGGLEKLVGFYAKDPAAQQKVCSLTLLSRH